MADDWDPFAMDEPEPAPAALADKGSSPDRGVKRLSKEDEKVLAKALFEIMQKEAPWDIPPSMKPDLTWHTPTCDSYNWQHIDVKFEVSDGIAYTIFNRPAENNSMQETLGAGINDALFALHARPDIRVAVFTGEGRMFCAGGDPKMWQAQALRAKGIAVEGDGTSGNRIKYAPVAESCYKSMSMVQNRAAMSGAFGALKPHEIGWGQLGATKQWHTWVTLPQFSIALVNGSAMGGGLGMCCMCDYVIACKKAYFVVSEVRIGVIPATISPYVVAKIGPANAKRVFNTAENMKAAESALEVGIVNEVVENMKEGHARVKEICKEIQHCAPEAVAAVKQLVFTVAGQPLADPIMFFTALKAAENLVHEESKAGRECEIKGETKPWELKSIVPLY